MIESIVVGTDGSDTANVAVAEAAQLAKAAGARVHVVSAYHPLRGAKVSASGAGGEQAAWQVQPDAGAESAVNEALAILRMDGVQAEAHTRTGDPAEAILEVAEEEDASLIVVGNKGMTGAKRFLLGSVPSKLSHHAPCSVLIVRTSDP
jgi:nucleotide-binding universal stress UspA family protein